MSDVVDRADGVQEVMERGASFARPAFGKTLGGGFGEIKRCACGALPVLRIGIGGVETLECRNGCRSAGPSKSRQILEKMWNLGA